MSRALLFAACFVMLSSPMLALQGGPHHVPKQVKQEIAALEEQWKTATLAGDVPAMDRLLSEDYVGISWTGQVNTKAMQLDRTRAHNININHMEINDLKVKVVGPVAIVTALADVSGTNDGSNINGDFRYTRVYQRSPSGVWQITNFEATRIGAPRRDHRPPPPSAAPLPPVGPPPLR